MIVRLELKESEARCSLRVIVRSVDGVVDLRLPDSAEYVGEDFVLTI